MALTKAHNRMIEGAAVNVKDFGAVGDGVTDDTAAIQAAIDYATSVGRTINFPNSTGRYVISSTIEIITDHTTIGKSVIGAITADAGVEIETSVVPAFHINSNASPAILEQLEINGFTFYVDGKLGYSEGVIKLTRTRNFEINNCHIREKSSGDCGFLIHLDGSYVGAVKNCTSLAQNCYLFDTFVDATTGQQDTVLFENCKHDGILMGFVRASTSGRHNYKFDTCKFISDATVGGLEQYAVTTLAADASAGATSVTLTDASSVATNIPFILGEDASAEVVIPTNKVGSVVTLATPLRTAKTSGDLSMCGAIGVHVASAWNITADNCHSEGGAAFVVLDSGVQNTTVENTHCSSKIVVLCRKSDIENVNVGSIRFQGITDWGTQYASYLTSSSLSGTDPNVFNFYGDVVISVTASTKNWQYINEVNTRWKSVGSSLPVVAVTTGAASIGSGVTVSCDYVSDFMPIGSTVRFSGGGKLVLTADAYCSYTSLIGDLTLANIASGEHASLEIDYITETTAIIGADVSDEDDGRSSSIWRLLSNLRNVFSIRGDGSVKGERFFSWSSREDTAGPSSVANGVATEIIPATFFDKGDVVLVTVFNNAAPFNFRGSCIVYRGSSASQHEVETIGTPVNMSFSTTSGNLEITQTSGATRNTYVSAIRYGKGLL